MSQLRASPSPGALQPSLPAPSPLRQSPSTASFCPPGETPRPMPGFPRVTPGLGPRPPRPPPAPTLPAPPQGFWASAKNVISSVSLPGSSPRPPGGPGLGASLFSALSTVRSSVTSAISQATGGVATPEPPRNAQPQNANFRRPANRSEGGREAATASQAPSGNGALRKSGRAGEEGEERKGGPLLGASGLPLLDPSGFAAPGAEGGQQTQQQGGQQCGGQAEAEEEAATQASRTSQQPGRAAAAGDKKQNATGTTGSQSESESDDLTALLEGGLAQARAGGRARAGMEGGAEGGGARGVEITITDESGGTRVAVEGGGQDKQRSVWRKISRVLMDNRMKGREDRERVLAEHPEEYQVLKRVLNILFVTVGVALLLSVLVVIIYTSVVQVDPSAEQAVEEPAPSTESTNRTARNMQPSVDMDSWPSGEDTVPVEFNNWMMRKEDYRAVRSVQLP